MSRSATPYAAGGAFTANPNAIRIDQPVEGFYRIRLVRGGHPVGVRVWYGAPLDPVTREELDRGWRWQATANGADIDLDQVWPQCAKDPIDQAEHDHLCAMQAWAVQHAPDHAAANPRKAVDLLSADIGF